MIWPLVNPITSVFGGPADKKNYDFIESKSEQKTLKVSYQENELKVFELFHQIRKLRESLENDHALFQSLKTKLQELAPMNWLLWVELFEIAHHHDFKEDKQSIENQLQDLKANSSKDISKLIDLGLETAIKNPLVLELT